MIGAALNTSEHQVLLVLRAVGVVAERVLLVLLVALDGERWRRSSCALTLALVLRSLGRKLEGSGAALYRDAERLMLVPARRTIGAGRAR